MIKAGIIGATGYAGNEIVRLLLGHREVNIEWLVSKSFAGQKYTDIYRNLFELVDMDCLSENINELVSKVDVVFTATPQGYLGSILNEKLLSRARFIDLSADYRIKDVNVYEEWYGIKHESPELIKEAVYGLCEINRDKIRNTRSCKSGLLYYLLDTHSLPFGKGKTY